MIYEINKKSPNLHDSVYIAPGAHVIGDVTIGEKSSVWFNAVIRGDDNTIDIGNCSNIQDAVVMHVDENNPLSIGNNVTIGHSATVHGCTIEDNVLIGIGAVILDGAYIESGCLIAAGALVTPGMRIPANSLVAGVPGKVIREIKEKENSLMNYSLEVYKARGAIYKDSLKQLK